MQRVAIARALVNNPEDVYKRQAFRPAACLDIVLIFVQRRRFGHRGKHALIGHGRDDEMCIRDSYRSAERGKCFIEYIPAENAWVPIEAAGWLYINCLWVSGDVYKRQR